MADEKPQQPKIVVDDDWKSQARAEKERLAAEQEKARQGAPAPAAGIAGAAPTAAHPEAAAGAEPAGERGGIPEANFGSHVATLASQALFALGALPDPQTGRRYLDVDLAKYYIDTLKMLETKTSGNLTPEEKKQLDSALYQLRSAYIEAASSGNII
jgi:hypothetical protein